MLTEWSREDAVGFWSVALCYGAAVAALIALLRADLWLNAGLLFFVAKGFDYLLWRTWEEGRV